MYFILASNDASTHRLKGFTVMTETERYDALRHCRYIDEIICGDIPWIIDLEFLEKHKVYHFGVLFSVYFCFSFLFTMSSLSFPSFQFYFCTLLRVADKKYSHLSHLFFAYFKPISWFKNSLLVMEKNSPSFYSPSFLRLLQLKQSI